MVRRWELVGFTVGTRRAEYVKLAMTFTLIMCEILLVVACNLEIDNVVEVLE